MPSPTRFGPLPGTQKKEYDKAIADYNEAIRLDPKNTTAYTSRAFAWGHKNEYDKAIADYNEVIRLDPKNAAAYSFRAFAWDQKKEHDRAIADYNESIRLDPKNAATYTSRAFAWIQKEEYVKAIADYNEVIRLEPQNAGAYNLLAGMLATCPEEKLRNPSKAVELATSACKLTDWKDPNFLFTLAAAYAATGRYEKAVEWQGKANRLYTKDDDRKRGELMLHLYRQMALTLRTTISMCPSSSPITARSDSRG